jgi:Flp pilus assembly protein TadD
MPRAFAGVILACTLAAPVAGEEALPPDQAEAIDRFQAGRQLMEREEYEEAVRELRAATSLVPIFAAAHYELGRSLMALGRYPEAATAYEDCRNAILSLGPQDLLLESRLRFLRDFSDRSHGNTGYNVPLEQARRLRQEKNLLAMAEGSGEAEVRVPAEVYLGLGSAYFRQGKLAPAEKAYRAAVQEDPGLGPAHNNLAVICMQTGRYEEARDEIAAAEAAGFLVSGQFKQDLEERSRESRSERP